MRLDCARDTPSAAQGFVLMTSASIRKNSEPGTAHGWKVLRRAALVPLAHVLQHPRSRSPIGIGCACAVCRLLVTGERPASVKKGSAPMLSIVPEVDKRWTVWRSLCLDMHMVRIAFRQRIMRGRSARWRVTEGPLCRHRSLFDNSWGATIRKDDGCLDDRGPHTSFVLVQQAGL